MNREHYYVAIKNSIWVMERESLEPEDAVFHFHDDYELFLFLGGNVDLYIEQSCHHLRRGHLLAFNDREIHRACNLGGSPYRRIAVHFNHRLIQGMNTAQTNLLACFQNHPPGGGNGVVLPEDQLQQLEGLCRRLSQVSQKDSYGNDVLTTAYLSELLVFCNTSFFQNEAAVPSPLSNLIADLTAYIHENLGSQLSLEQIAKEFSIDRYYLCHLFKKQTGTTLYRYILIKKIALAKQLLSDGTSVTDACILSGFNDYNNFIRTFKKFTGIPPGKYR